ncbi:PepSY domain-containing protein [Paracoccus sp. Ld10]|uniref:PepSY domain-containing protein n=1 Tax=Paracoccus sp. Ld10 TaxID=649158 RepID=UPI0038640C03
MTRITNPMLLVLVLMAPLAALSQPVSPTDPWGSSFQPQPFHRMAEAVTARYHGRLVAAETRPPLPEERAAGVELIYEFRLLTAQRNILNIRVDARTGRFLDVAGRGQLEARRAPRIKN